MLSLAAGLPSLCAVCRRWSGGRVCEGCLQRFAAVQPRCLQCGVQLEGASRCGACVLRADPPVQRTVTAVDYAFPWDGLIAGFKFRQRLDLAGSLAALLHAAVQREGLRPDLVVPVPLATGRLRERGYNQAWEIARRVARRLGLAAHPAVLLRLRETAHQLGLREAERERNLRGAFLVDPRQAGRVDGRSIALVDDVATSGATGDEAARALRAAGAREVQLWVVARTPAPA
jgi:ComF family protein